MPKNNETTTKFKVDISELKSAMQEAKRAVAVANSEFKATTSTMEDWSKSTDGISAKLKQLDTTINSQKTVLANYEKQLELTKQQYPEGGKAVDDLIIKINNQKSAINKTEREQKKFEQSLKEVKEAEKEASKTGKEVADVLDEMGKEAKGADEGFTVLKGAVANFAGNMLTSLVGAVKDGIGSIMGLAEETREYRNEMAKLDTAFASAGHSTETATETYKELYAVLGDEGQAVEATNFLAKLCDTEEDLAKWTEIATGVYGEFGSSLPIESLTEASNETAKTGQITGALADALNWAGVSEDDFQASLDKCSNEQERQSLITKTLNGLYSESAKRFKETNKSVIDANKANSDYTDTVAKMGAKIEPITTAVKKGFNLLLMEVLKLVENVDFTGFSNTVGVAFNFLSTTILPALVTAFKFVIEVVKLLISWYGTLVNALTTLWNKVQSFISFWYTAWDTVKSSCSKAVTTITKTFSGLPSKLLSIGRDVVAGLWNGISSKVDWLKGQISGFVGNVTSWLKRFFKIGSPSKLMAEEVGKWLPEGIAVGVDKNAKSVLNSMKNLAVDTVSATRNGLAKTTGSITSGGSVGGGVVNNFYQTINSPKELSRLDIYRQSKNLLNYAGGVR